MASPVTEAARRIFADFADPQAVNRDAAGAWKAPLWRALEEAGLTLAWVPEALGGAGASLAEGFEVLAAAGRHALAAPLGETLLAGWCLARGALSCPSGVMSLVPAQPGDSIGLDADGTLSGRARAVPFAPEAAHFAVLAQGTSSARVALVEARACTIDPGRTLAGDSQGTVLFDRARALAHAAVDMDATQLLLMGCVARAVQSAGALQALLELALRYAGERVAFERPIGRFQAVQHNLARLAGEASAALAASASAADAIERAERSVERAGRFDEGVFLEAVAAKIRCAEAAHEGAAIAHQVFGAIGYSQEHTLHRFTLRLLAWREDFGNESLWAAELGKRVAERGADALWPLVAAR